METSTHHLVRAARLEEVRTAGRLVVQLEGHTLVLFAHSDGISAVDNRCPHMGFPLHRGTLKDGILTCHWHHARFDLSSGGTFDPWADDVRVFPVEIRDGEVWVDLAPRADPRAHQLERVRHGLEHHIPLVVARSVIYLLETGEDPVEPFRIGLEFGARYRARGWGPGLTVLTCMYNLLPHLHAEDRPRALYHGLADVAGDTEGEPPRFPLRPLPSATGDPVALKRWFRRFVEARDDEGAERCIISMVQTVADRRQIADMLFAAATDHRYLDVGHVVDFTNKALEALDAAGWEHAEIVLSGLAPRYAEARRMEESTAWRQPVDLVEILDDAFPKLPQAINEGQAARGTWAGRDLLVDVLLGEDPQGIAGALLDALRAGAADTELAAAVTYAAALRIAQFHTSNEFSDWDTALHTFSFSHAVLHGLRRAPSLELLRGVFDAAMSVYLDRFLNIPPAPLPDARDTVSDAAPLLRELAEVMNQPQQVNEAGTLVGRYLHSGGEPAPLLAALGGVLLREDRNFHTIQAVEAAFRLWSALRGTGEASRALVAGARYLAAHVPTVRAQDQTYQIALRLHRGERLYIETDRVVATVLFADIVGSTEQASELGDRRWRDVLRRYRELARAEITRYRGREIEWAGDGFLATFDGAARAIRCAQAVIEAARRIDMAVRAGLHTGEIEVTGEKISGICIHIGARVAAQAHPGEVLVTATLRDLVAGSGLQFADRGTHALKGIPGEWRLYAVAGAPMR